MGEKQVRIGLLEDNPTLSELTTTMLELAGHTVVAYGDGASCLKYLLAVSSANEKPSLDVLIIDLNLPGGLSGCDVIAYIRYTLHLNNLPIIVVSGAAQDYLGQVRKQFPSIPIIQKPFPLQTLLDTVNACASLPQFGAMQL